MNVFILGITGRTGNRIAKILIRDGHTVSGLYRHARDVSRVLDMGAHAVAGDIASISEQYLAEASPRTRFSWAELLGSLEIIMTPKVGSGGCFGGCPN